jgi:hypothetical protein
MELTCTGHRSVQKEPEAGTKVTCGVGMEEGQCLPAYRVHCFVYFLPLNLEVFSLFSHQWAVLAKVGLSVPLSYLTIAVPPREPPPVGDREEEAPPQRRK